MTGKSGERACGGDRERPEDLAADRDRQRKCCRGSQAASSGPAVVNANPVAFTNKAVENGARGHVPSDDELSIIWRALERSPPDDHYSVILKLLLLTGARRDEVGALRWDEVDLDDATITLPPARTKNRREHVIPLSQPALALLAAQPRRISADGALRGRIFGNGSERG
jgi:integrase